MRILLCGIVGNDNFGDEAMFKVIYNKLYKDGNSIDVLTYNIKRAKERFPSVSFIPIPRYKRRDILLSLLLGKELYIPVNLEDYQSLIIAGGGNLNSIYTGHLAFIYSLVSKFRKSGRSKYIEFRPQSIGPFYGKLKLWTIKRLLQIVKMADVFHVREKLSYEFLRGYNLNAILSKDDAYELEVSPVDCFMESCDSERYIGIHIRPWNRDLEFFLRYFREFFEILSNRDLKFLAIPIAISGDFRYIDNYFLKEFKGKYNLVFVDEICDVFNLIPENIKYLISLCKVTIGMSYHFNVFSLSLGIPSVAIYIDEYYRIKNLGLYEAFGDPSKVINILNVSGTELARYVNKIYEEALNER